MALYQVRESTFSYPTPILFIFFLFVTSKILFFFFLFNLYIQLIMAALANLHKLEALDLSDNQFSGSLEKQGMLLQFKLILTNFFVRTELSFKC